MSSPTVAVLGASTDRGKFSNKSVRAHLAAGYTVYPVNPRGGTIEGLPVYASIADVPAGPLDRVSMYLTPPVGFGQLERIAAKGCRELWLNPGTASPELVERALELGLNPMQRGSIVDAGYRPTGFPYE